MRPEHGLVVRLSFALAHGVDVVGIRVHVVHDVLVARQLVHGRAPVPVLLGELEGLEVELAVVAHPSATRRPARCTRTPARACRSATTSSRRTVSASIEALSAPPLERVPVRRQRIVVPREGRALGWAVRAPGAARQQEKGHSPGRDPCRRRSHDVRLPSALRSLRARVSARRAGQSSEAPSTRRRIHRKSQATHRPVVRRRLTDRAARRRPAASAELCGVRAGGLAGRMPALPEARSVAGCRGGSTGSQVMPADRRDGAPARDGAPK